MINGYKYRIYPNKEQKVLLEKHIGSCRFVYNKLLHIKKTLYEKFKMSISEFELNNHLTVLKEIYPFLKEVNSQSLQQASKNLNSAYNHFFKDGSGFPTKKSKKNPLQSFQIPQHYRIEDKKIWLSKIGWVKIKLHRDTFFIAYIIKIVGVTGMKIRICFWALFGYVVSWFYVLVRSGC